MQVFPAFLQEQPWQQLLPLHWQQGIRGCCSRICQICQIFGSYVIREHGYFTASVTSQEVTLGGDDVTDTA